MTRILGFLNFFFSINLPIEKYSLNKLLIATNNSKNFLNLYLLSIGPVPRKTFLDSNYTECFMLYNLNHFNSEWSLSFSDQSYTEKTKKKKEKWVGWTKDRSVCYNQIVAGIV